MRSSTTRLAALTLGAGLTIAIATPTLASAAHGVGPTVHSITYTASFADGTYAFTGDAKMPKLGDRFVDSATLRHDGKKAGTFYRVAEIVAGNTDKNRRFINTATYVVAGGQFTTLDESGDVNTEPQALVGGTGIFAGASGTVVTHTGTSSGTFVVTYVINR